MGEVRITRQRVDYAGKAYRLPAVEGGYIPDGLELLLHNWVEPAALTSAWATDVVAGQSGAEERRGLIGRPYRTVRHRVTAFSRPDLTRALNWAQRLQQHGGIAPLSQDHTRLDATAAGGATVLSASTVDRRYFAGGLVALVDRGPGLTVEAVELVRLQAVTASTLTLTAPLALTWEAGSYLMPMLEVEPRLETEIELRTDEAPDTVPELVEVLGASALPPWVPGWAHPVEPTYRQHLISPVRPDWGDPPRLFSRRQGERFGQGLSGVFHLEADGPRLGIDFSAKYLTRAASVRALRFLDACRGRLRPFWMFAPFSPWEVLDVDPTMVKVRPHGSLEDLTRFVRHIGAELPTGELFPREINRVSTDSGDYVLHFSDPLPNDALAPRRIRPAYFMRWDSDEIEENWTTDTIMSLQLSAIEVKEERTVEVVRRTDAVPSALPNFEGVQGLFLSPTLTNVGGDGTPITTWGDFLNGGNSLVSVAPPTYTKQTMGAMVNLRAADAGGAKSALRWSANLPCYSNVWGLTVAIAVQQVANPGYSRVDDYLFGMANEADSAVDKILWTPFGVQFWEESGVADDDLLRFTPDLLYPHGQWHVLVLTWKPGQYVRVYRDGDLVGQTTRAPIDVPVGVSLAARQGRFLQLANNAATIGTPTAADTAVNAVGVYGRALHHDEIDILGAYLAARVGSTWRRLVQ